MQSVLRWSLEHSSPLANDRPPLLQKKIDPEIIDMILGKPDAVLMKENMAVAMDVTRSQDDRLAALDDLEMLVEQIDNANDLAKLNLWAPLLLLLGSKESSLDIKVQVLWIIGTALQNNPTAQDEYLSLNPLPTLLEFLTPSPLSSVAARSKTIYVLSGLLKHNAPAVATLNSPGVDGWLTLHTALKDPEISVRTKLVFLLNSLLIPPNPDPNRIPSLPLTQSNDSVSTSGPALHTDDEPRLNDSEPIHPNSHAALLKNPSRTDTSGIVKSALEEHGIIDTLISVLTSLVPDAEQANTDFEEKTLRLFSTYLINCNGKMSGAQRASLVQWIRSHRRHVTDLLSISETDALLQEL